MEITLNTELLEYLIRSAIIYIIQPIIRLVSFIPKGLFDVNHLFDAIFPEWLYNGKMNCWYINCMIRYLKHAASLWMISPVSVVDHCINDGVHLLGEFGRVGGQLLCWRSSTSLLGLRASVLSAGVLVLTSFAFALFQPDLLLHLLQVSIFNRLKREKSHSGAEVKPTARISTIKNNSRCKDSEIISGACCYTVGPTVFSHWAGCTVLWNPVSLMTV